MSELAFLSDRERNRGEFTPADTIVLHLYGRYCNANRFAGETDLFEALAEEGMTMTHIIGPQTAHRYHPAAKEEINRRIDSIATKGRDPMPHKVRFTTWTLRYNQMEWITVDALDHHWERARVDATSPPPPAPSE